MWPYDVMDLQLPVIFTADTHLDPGENQRIYQFIQFTRFVARQRARLYILGDLFNFWAGDAQARMNTYRPLIRALRCLSQKGLLFFLHGNRDFLYSNFWRKKGGNTIYDGAILQYGSTSVVVYHGDAFCTADVVFQKMRLWFPSKPLYFFSRLLPAPWCMRIGCKFRKMSQDSISQKSRGQIGPNLGYIRQIMSESKSNVLVCGHFHQRQLVRLGIEGRETLLYFLPESVDHIIHYLLWKDDRFVYEEFA